MEALKQMVKSWWIVATSMRGPLRIEVAAVRKSDSRRQDFFIYAIGDDEVRSMLEFLSQTLLDQAGGDFTSAP